VTSASRTAWCLAWPGPSGSSSTARCALSVLTPYRSLSAAVGDTQREPFQPAGGLSTHRPNPHWIVPITKGPIKSLRQLLWLAVATHCPGQFDLSHHNYEFQTASRGTSIFDRTNLQWYKSSQFAPLVVRFGSEVSNGR